MNPQTFFPRNVDTRDIALISTLGMDRPAEPYAHHPEWTDRRRGAERRRRHICRQPMFLMVAAENHYTHPAVAYTEWENYIKVGFRLSGRVTTILDGFGEHENTQPEAYIASAPARTIKVDRIASRGRFASVSLCLLRDFFPAHMGLAVEELPEPLRAMALPEATQYGFHRMTLTREMATAANAILTAPFRLRRQSAYCQAKAVELMCLLIDHMTSVDSSRRMRVTARARESRLQDARQLLTRHYAENLTLEHIGREVGLNRMALTSGFRRLFGVSVHDCLLKERMDRAYALLQDGTQPIAQVGQAVGYRHSCTFSTAFRAYFSCSPREVRSGSH